MKNTLTNISNAAYVITMILFVFILFMIPKCSTAQTRFMTSDDFRGKMRGFNLGAVLTWDQLKAKNIREMKMMGANHGRAWVQINHAQGSSKYFWCDYKGNKIPSPLPVIDSLLKLAEKDTFYIVLTVEVFPHQAATDWWKNQSLKTAIANFWRDTLASRYKTKKIIAAYDLMNEPRVNKTLTTGMTRVQIDTEYLRFYADIINAVRTVDGSHCIAVEVLDNQMLARVKPLPHRNLIYSPHGYSPLYITNQGSTDPASAVYPDYKTMLRDSTTPTYVENYFPNVTYWRNPAEFQQKYNAVIWIGEFSCINWAPKNTYGEWTSTRWVKDAIAYMESKGWSWAYHARREYQGWEADLPSSWYFDPANGVTFSNGKPSKLPPSSARSGNAPTMLVLKSAFLKNTKYYAQQ